MADNEKKEQSAEDLVKGLRANNGHLPTKYSEAQRKKREEAAEKRKARRQGYVNEGKI